MLNPTERPPMTLTDRAIEREARSMQQRINSKLPSFRARVAHLHPVEVMAILGTLTSEVFRHVPRDERGAACNAWTETIKLSVRDSLG